MGAKEVEIPNVGTVLLFKRKSARSLRISLSPHGQVRVSLPTWVPYIVGEEFARSKVDWINEQRKPAKMLIDGQPIGKAHHLRFYVVNRTKIMTRVHNNMVLVALPGDVLYETPEAQASARKAAVRALRIEAEQLLPRRLLELAKQHGFDYHSVSIKQMKGRWGSCNLQKDIVLNCYLMQLPWDLIDYVIIHELTHTKIMAHGAPFWVEVAKHVHNLPDIRRTMRTKQPTL